jgi:hypothetical protein
MNISKPFIIIICLSVSLVSICISNWLPEEPPNQQHILRSIQHFPHKEDIENFSNALNSLDRNTLKTLLSQVKNEDNDAFIDAIKQGSITNIWGIQKDGDISRIAIEATMQYHQERSVRKKGNTLFVFQLKDSKWQIEWYFSSAILLPQAHKK